MFSRLFRGNKMQCRRRYKPRSTPVFADLLRENEKQRNAKQIARQSGQRKSETLVSQRRIRSKHSHGGSPSTRYINSSKSTVSGEENRLVRKCRTCAKFPPGSQPEN